MVYIFLADGFEEIEALAPVDMLRRARVDVKMVKVGSTAKKVLGSRSIEIIADIHESEIDLDNLVNLEMIILPGGAAGVENLYGSETVEQVVKYCVGHKISIGAICAAPSILSRRSYLKNIKATAFPTFRHYLTEGGAIPEDTQNVVTDGLFTTADGVLSSIDFALELVRVLKGSEWAQAVGTNKPAPGH